MLTHASLEQSPPPLLIAVNSSEATPGVATAAARKALEAELTRVRLAKATAQGASGRSRAARGIAAGDPNQPFTFDQLGSGVEFVACSAAKPGEVSQFVQKIAR
jgi:hypothetical protein